MLRVILSFDMLFHYAEYLRHECHSAKCCSADCHSGVNFTNILLAAFAPKSLGQKITNPNCKHIKDAQKTFILKSAHKILVKLTPGGRNWQLIDPNSHKS